MTITVHTAAKAAPSASSQPGSNAAVTPADAGGLFSLLLGAQLGQAFSDPLKTSAQGEGDASMAKEKPATLGAEANAATPLFQMAPVTLPVVPQPAQPLKLDATAEATGVGDAAAAGDPTLWATSLARRQEDGNNLPPQAEEGAGFLPLMQAQGTHGGAETGRATSANVPVFTVQVPVSDQQWPKAMGQQLMNMALLKADTAQIQINPPHLGPIEVNLKLNNDQAQVVFTAALPATREALENSMPRLASMLSASGIQLTDAQVSSGQSGDPRQQFFQQQAAARQKGAAVAEDDPLAAIRAARSIVSIFA